MPAPGIITPFPDALSVTNIAALRALIVNPKQKYFQVLGYYTANDGGGGFFYVDTADTTSADNGGTVIVTTTGNIRIKRLIDRSLSVKHFGARGNGTNDDITFIQTAIDWCIQNKRGILNFPPGIYLISDTIKVGYGITPNAFDFTTLYLMGSSKWETGGVCRILVNFTDRPAINFQGARHSGIEKISIKGLNTAPTTIVGANQHLVTSNSSSWVTSGCSNGRYNPYCAIAIDAYAGVKPASDFYPNDDYGRLTSSGVIVRDVEIKNFVVGIAISPSDNNNNAEDCEFTHVSISDCVWCYSSGASQNRNNTIIYGSTVRSFCGVTSIRHGKQIANFPILRNMDMGVMYRLFEVYPLSGSCGVDALHAEAYTEIGILGNAASSVATPMVIKEGQFQRQGASGCYGVLQMPVVFDGCSFTTNGDFVLGFFLDTNAPKTFRNCSFAGTTPVIAPTPGTTHLMRFRDCFFRNTGGGGTAYEISDEITVNTLPARQIVFPYTKRVMLTTGKQYALLSQDLSFTINVISTNAGATVTFTWQDANDANLFRVGDWISWIVNVESNVGTTSQVRMPVYKITSIDTGTSSFVGTAFSNVNLLNATNDRFPYMYRQSFFNATQATATVTSGSNVLTAVTNIANFAVGDFLQGTGLPTNCRITAIDSGANTITIHRNATASGTGVNISGSILTPLN